MIFELTAENIKKHGTATTVNGKAFFYGGYAIGRCTVALCVETGEIKKLYGGGYISNDLTVRKAIALHFNLPTFRK